MEIGYSGVAYAAHKLCLPYKSHCSVTHGHSYYIDIKVKVQQLNEEGMVIDYTQLKNVIDTLDHCYLNDIVSQPTAENIVNYLLDQIETLITQDGTITVRVSETERSYARDTRVVRRK